MFTYNLILLFVPIIKNLNSNDYQYIVKKKKKSNNNNTKLKTASNQGIFKMYKFQSVLTFISIQFNIQKLRKRVKQNLLNLEIRKRELFDN